MSPEHAAAIAALSDVVETLRSSTSKVAKEALKELNDDHAAVMELVYLYIAGADNVTDGMTAESYLRAAVALGICRGDIADGAEVLIVQGRYAVQYGGGLKLGPKVSP